MQYDKEMAARVWKRVQESASPAGETPAQDPVGGLWDMILHKWQDAQVFQHLASRFTGENRKVLLEMARRERSHMDCLKGIYALLTGKPPQIRQVKPELGPVDQLLRRCYGRQMQSLAWYESKTADAQYGPVYRDLATQEREHCRRLLELISAWGK